MPRFLQPKLSTEHRVAAIALYRALLSQCSAAPLPEDDRLSLRHAIQNKFRKNRKIESQYQLGLGFRAGYELLDHLDACIADDAARSDTLVRVISALPPALKRPPSIYYPRPRPPEPPNPRLACLPPERAVLNVRPYKETSGPRHVPILASANGMPFLRLGKPQPLALSRIIHQRLKRKHALFDTKVYLANWHFPICQHEDEWDALVNENTRYKEDKTRWVDAVHLSMQENQEAFEREQMKDKIVSRKMLRIVDLETELALKEGQTLIRGRKSKFMRMTKS